MKGLTKKQRDILNFIQSYIKQYNYSPSYREIMNHFSFASPGSVYKYIQALQRKGMLTSEKQCSRSLLPLENPNSSYSITSEITLPFIGKISLENPIELFIHSQSISVPSILVAHPENTYILQIQGDSLQSECIADGDLLLVEARQEPEAGEIIVGTVDQTTVIKRYYPEGQYIRLESHSHQPLTLRAESIIVQGILVGLLRNY